MTILANSLIRKTKRKKLKQPKSNSKSSNKIDDNFISNSKSDSIFKYEDQWPLQRNIFFRPERMKYVKKINLPKTCVFCMSANKKINFKTLCVYKSKYSQIILNKYPYNNGHLLVLPLSHCGDLMQLNSESYFDLQETLRLGIQAIQEVYNPQGLNIGMNHGKASGAGIPDHLHYHLVPRWSGDLNFFPLIAETKIVIESLESSYKKFKNYFNKMR